MSLPPENAVKTRCLYGHELAGDNLHLMVRGDGRRERVCRVCRNRRRQEHFRRHYIPHPRVRALPAPPKSRPEPIPAIERILGRIARTDDCWFWLGARSNGYGVVQRGRRGEGTTRVHRIVYEHFKGPIPDGLDVMHTCHNRGCCNPDHLQAGTRAENMRQSQIAGRLKRRR